MAACGSLQHIFETPLPENPTLLESLSSWKPVKPPMEQSSFTEIFGELHFKENSQSLMSPHIGGKMLDKDEGFHVSTSPEEKYSSGLQKSDSFSSMYSESLQLCTEGLGFESSDDVEDMKSAEIKDWQSQEEKASSSVTTKHVARDEGFSSEFRRGRTSGGAFPPPISCIGKSGKPWVYFKSYRQDGRFVLKEVRIPTQEFLHACRQDGRLKLHFVQPNDEILEEEEEEEEEEEIEDVEELYEEEKEEEINDDVYYTDVDEWKEETQAETNRTEVQGDTP